MWHAVKARLEQLDKDSTRFEGVTMLGVDEHVWYHFDPRKRGPKMLTGRVDLTRDNHGDVHARLLDLVPVRDGVGDRLTIRGNPVVVPICNNQPTPTATAPATPSPQPDETSGLAAQCRCSFTPCRSGKVE